MNEGTNGSYETIRTACEAGVARIVLDRPERKNAITPTMWLELARAIASFETDDTGRVLVIEGAGGDFCSGADLFTPRPPDIHPLTYMRNAGKAVLALHQVAKPTIAKIDGVAIGAGLNLALGCDFVVASTRSRFSAMFAPRGLSVDAGGSWLLPRIVGLQRAKRLVLVGDVIGSAEAERLGLVTAVVGPDAIDEQVDDLARRLALGPPIALSLSKRLLNHSFAASFDQALEDECRAQMVNYATEDPHEARDAFAAKRPPAFTGRSRV